MIARQQIAWLRKHAKAIGSSRLTMMCEEVSGLIGLYGLRAADLAAVKSIGRELPYQMGASLGHNVARQNNSAECTTCGASGGINDTATGIKLTGAIFSDRCTAGGAP